MGPGHFKTWVCMKGRAGAAGLFMMLRAAPSQDVSSPVAAQGSGGLSKKPERAWGSAPHGVPHGDGPPGGRLSRPGCRVRRSGLDVQTELRACGGRDRASKPRRAWVEPGLGRSQNWGGTRAGAGLGLGRGQGRGGAKTGAGQGRGGAKTGAGQWRGRSLVRTRSAPPPGEHGLPYCLRGALPPGRPPSGLWSPEF